MSVMNSQMDGQTDGRTERQKDRKTERQTNRQRENIQALKAKGSGIQGLTWQWRQYNSSCACEQAQAYSAMKVESVEAASLVASGQRSLRSRPTQGMEPARRSAWESRSSGDAALFWITEHR